MGTDLEFLDDLERSQAETTRRRRSKRARRFYQTVFVFVAFAAFLVLAAPSLVCHTGIGRSILASQLANYGWKGAAAGIDVGWITPLSIKQLELHGQSGQTEVTIESINTSLTVADLFGLDDRSRLGEITLRGVKLRGSVAPGDSSFEQDLAQLLEPSEDSSAFAARLKIQDIQAELSETLGGRVWLFDQTNATVDIEGDRVTGDIAGVVTEPDGGGGSIQSQFVWNVSASDPATIRRTGQASEPSKLGWNCSIETDSFPLSVMDLVSLRFNAPRSAMHSSVIRESSAGTPDFVFPQSFSGDTTGRIRMVGSAGGDLELAFDDIQIRGLKTSGLKLSGHSLSKRSAGGTSRTVWANELATLDGELACNDGWLFGYGLHVTTDFASATLDGACPLSISLTGSEDNPLSWLQSLDGIAKVDVDLPALDRAMPGLIPLRENATLVSGRATAVIENKRAASQVAATAKRRTRLSIQCDTVRAQTAAGPVRIEPITLAATVSDDQGTLTAETFKLTSVFATASGHGTLRSGTADFDVDFGRLYAMLQPIVDLSETTIGGTAGGKVQWNVRSGEKSFENWQLAGDAEARDLMVTLADGFRFKRSLVKGSMSAAGQWNGTRLAELTNADVTLRSGGVLARASLIEPVGTPTEQSIYPIRLSGDGRLENLSESLRPWLPKNIRDASGRVTGSLIARISQSGGTLQQAELDLQQPKVAFGKHWYSQDNVKVRFRGILDWPAMNLSTQDCSVAGDAFSFAVQGEANKSQTQLDVAWTANLERLQRSIESTVARPRVAASVRPISYRPTEQTHYHVRGLCDGHFTVTRTGNPNRLRIETDATAKDLVVVSQAARVVPPGTPSGPRSSGKPASGSRLSTGFANRPAIDDDVLWNEPQIKIRGPVEVDLQSGAVRVAGTQVSTDWFAGTLSGEVATGGDRTEATLSGPSRIKMDALTARLSKFLGTQIWAQGIQETPLSLTLRSDSETPLAFDLSGTIGWDRIDTAGITLGKSNIPFHMNEQQLSFERSTIPVQSLRPIGPLMRGAEGRDTFARATAGGVIRYDNTPVTVRLSAGARVDAIRITPSDAAGWLQYLAPIVAGATRIEGLASAELGDTLIVIDDPAQSRVSGTLTVEQMKVTSGPLADQLIRGIESIKSVAAMRGRDAAQRDPTTLITMPPQTIDFSVENGFVSHRRMYFQIDRGQLMTSGQVGMNSQLNLTAHVPLDASWLGSDLQGLAGQTLTLPIGGTLSRPALDLSAVQRIFARLGTQAGAEVIQNRLDGLIQKQLGNGFDQLNQGLEKILGF